MSGFIGLKIKGEFVDLKQDLELNVSAKNPMFTRQVIPGTVTYSFDVPATERNERIMGFVRHLDNVEKLPELDAELYFGGVLYKRGDFVVKEANNSGYKGNFRADVNALKRLEEYSLKDFDYGEITVDNTIFRGTFEALYDITPGDNFAIEVRGTVYEQDNMFQTSGAVPQSVIDQINNNESGLQAKSTFVQQFDNDDRQYRIEIEANDLSEPFTVNGDPASNESFFNALHVWEDGDSIDYPTAFAHQMDEEMDLCYPDKVYCLPMVKNEQYWDKSQHPDPYDYINMTGIRSIHDGYLTDRVPPESFADNAFRNTFIPFLFIKHVIKTVFNEIGYNVGGDFFQDTELDCLALYNRYYDNLGTHYREGYGYWLEDGRIELSNCAPDVNALDFIKDIVLHVFNLNLKIDNVNNTIVLDFASNIVKSNDYRDLEGKSLYTFRIEKNERRPFSFQAAEPESSEMEDYLVDPVDVESKTKVDPVASYGDLPTNVQENDVLCLVRNYNTYYKSIYDADSDTLSWTRYTYNYYEHNPSGQEDTEAISADAAFVQNILLNPGSADNEQLFPYALEDGSSPVYFLGVRESPYRLIFYRGQDAYLDGGTFVPQPFASSDIYSRIGTKLGDYALRYEGDNGLYKTFWKAYEDFLQSAKRVTLRLDLDIADIIGIEIDDRLLIDGRFYFWEEMTFSVNNQSGIGPMEFKLYKQE